jgi:hypothetical protein
MKINFSNEDFSYAVKWKILNLTIVLKTFKSNQKDNAGRLL